MSTAAITSTGIGIDHVLIATDFSHQSDDVVHYGLNFARLFGAHAEIAYVLPTEEYALAGAEGLCAGRDAARRDLLELKSRLRRISGYNDDSDQKVTLLEGPVAECLMQCAREKRTDLIVVGTHGRGGLGKILLGSVAEKVFRHSTAPVLTIGPNIHHWHAGSRLHDILAPCDLMPKSHEAVRFACQLARAHDSTLTVINVVESTSESAGIEQERIKSGVEQRLADIVSGYAKRLELHYRVEFGKVAPEILDAASKIGAELIVLGVRCSSGVLDRFQWPVASELVREATCPVLTIRQRSSVR